MNPCEGRVPVSWNERVPVSWNECANWLEARKLVLYREDSGRWVPTINTVDEFRDALPETPPADRYLLVDLVAAPEGMDGGGWLGQGKDVPDGWEWRGFTNDGWSVAGVFTNDGWSVAGVSDAFTMLVQCRPPAPKREPEWVPLTKLVGRTVWEFDVPVHAYEGTVEAMRWWPPETPYHMYRPFPDGTLDLDTGRVKVEPRATT